MARQPSRPGPAGRDLADAEQRFAILNHEACARAPFTNGTREGRTDPVRAGTSAAFTRRGDARLKRSIEARAVTCFE